VDDLVRDRRRSSSTSTSSPSGRPRPGSCRRARSHLPSTRSILLRQQPGAVGRAVGLVQDHALGEQARRTARRGWSSEPRAWRGSRSANRAGAGSRARRRRYTGRPASSSRSPRGRTARFPAGRGEPVEVPARIDEGVERVGLRARRARRRSGRRRASRSDGDRADCPACRSRHPRAARRQVLLRHRTMPHLPQWIAGIGAPQ
jgi:hypothetical protein